MNLIVVNQPKNWSLHIPGVPVVAARTYLTDPQYSEQRNLRVFNLCRSYRYQSTGYYVSLLAMARGQKPLPSITTIQDMKTLAIARVVADDLDELIQRSLRPLRSDFFTLRVYFGKNLAKRYDELSQSLFRSFQAPLLRADFARVEEEWVLRNIGPIAGNDIPEGHRDFVIQSATEFFRNNRLPRQRRSTASYDMAILLDPDAEKAPSNKGAIRKFVSAARRLGIDTELIDQEDFGRIAEFDALFIRETTAVHHHTYRFARRAAAEGLVVIDDPDSIARCTNKVYLAEMLRRYKVPIPQTLVVHKDNRDRIVAEIGLPCILKQPDSSFSQGVFKANDEAELQACVDRLLEKSDLIVAQKFMPTPFDWRIGILEREAIFACKYFMAGGHWQITETGEQGVRYGDVEAVPLDQVPEVVLKTALRAAKPIGDGLYGVDVKQFGDEVCVIEVNDNPNVDAGYEDRILGDTLYDRIMGVFLKRIQSRRNGVAKATT
ncbi:MAG: RimK family protein [Phycisphaerae bacterium]|nr:RimK family protein [Phycisphaerae bacterium]